jgi:hypothetical protein
LTQKVDQDHVIVHFIKTVQEDANMLPTGRNHFNKKSTEFLGGTIAKEFLLS